MRLFPAWLRAAIVPGLLVVLAGCGDSNKDTQVAGPPPAVTVVKVISENIRPASTFTGRVEAKDKVDLRARVDGFLEKRLFTEGHDVKEGDLLFVIEQGYYKAALDEAKANVEKAQATLQLADLEVDRQKQLVARNAGTQAKLDEVTAKQGEARGVLLAQKAALERAELQLSYTEIKAPIAGRIGRALVSVGNFVGPSSGPLATIVSQDPIYVTFPVTQREVMEIRKEGSTLKKAAEDVLIYVQLADGSRYDKPGKVNFLDVTVSQGTDTVLVRASFPNPDRVLVDGQLVTVVVESEAGEQALLVPQQALQYDQSGAYVLVVDKANKVEVRRVDTSVTHGARVVVRKGLTAGELVITQGIQRVRPGQVVQPTEEPPAIASPADR